MLPCFLSSTSRPYDSSAAIVDASRPVLSFCEWISPVPRKRVSGMSHGARSEHQSATRRSLSRRQRKVEEEGTDLINFVGREWSVGGHEKMTARSGNERSNHADEIVVHVAGISKRLRRCCHHGRNLFARYGVSTLPRNEGTQD